jgi:hypothetical protein
MYQKHKIFEPELSNNTRLWRYMDFTKYVSMLSTRSLFFVRLDKLRDRWEGKYPKKQWTRLIEAAKQALNEIIKQWERNINNAQKVGDEKTVKAFMELKNFFESHPPGYTEFLKCQTSWTAVNCWHEGEHESAAMWKLYLTSSEGIAIESDFDRMKQSFANLQEDVFIGRVLYKDYDKEDIPTSNMLYPLMTKRKSFEHEKEVRAVIWRALQGSEQIRNENAKAPWNDPGELIPVNMDVLIRAVYVAPGSPEWFVDIVKDVTYKYGFDKSIENSIIDEDPIY